MHCLTMRQLLHLLTGLALLFTWHGSPSVAWAAPSGSDSQKAKLLIAAQGIPKARIVIGNQASEVEKFAAEELQKYVKAVSGADLPISTHGSDSSLSTIFIGTPASNPGVRGLKARELKPAADDSATDGFLIKTFTTGSKQGLLLGSNGPRGVLFAVYGFLEQCLGVRFFGFDRSGEIIPSRTTINIDPIDLWQRPRFKFRISNNNNFVSSDRKMLTRVADWSVKNGYNAFLIPVEDTSKVATEELTRRGMEIWGGGHVWGEFTPEKKLFASHPEYFPLIDGKRTFTGDKFAISFCYSNPDAMRSFVAKAVAYVRQRPMLTVFACWPQDGSQGWAQCQCDGCRKYSFSDWNVAIANAVAQAFETDPVLKNIRVQWIAYNECSVPPTKVRPYKKGRKLDIFYTNGARDYLAPMDSEANHKCADWLRHDALRKRVNTNGKLNPGDDDLAAYQRLDSVLRYLRQADYHGNISLLEYVNYHIGYWLDLPYMQNVLTGPWPAQVYQKDLQFYLSRGIDGWSDCFDWPNDAPDPFWNRLMARLAWDPYADVDAIKKDFYAKYYGPADQIMRQYFDDIWQTLTRAKPQPADYGRLKLLRIRLREALRFAGSDTANGKHISEVMKWHESLRLAKSSTNLIEDGSFEEEALQEGQSRALRGAFSSKAMGDWRIVRPSSGSKLQPSEGHNFLQCSGSHCGLKIFNSNYVFEARTIYKLEADVFPTNESGVLGIAIESPSAAENELLAEKRLSGLKQAQWNHVTLEWQCEPGSAAEGKRIGIICNDLEGAALDNMMLKARVAQ